MRDCKNRNYRFIDDYRGYRCDVDWTNPQVRANIQIWITLGDNNKLFNPQRKESTDGLFSSATTAYKVEKVGGNYVIKAMATTGSLVSQMYEVEGMSHFAYVNVTSVLVNQRSSPGDISVSGETLNSLAYEFADSSYKWNVDRDLKAREPFLSSGMVYEDNQSTLKQTLLKGLDTIGELLHAHGNDQVIKNEYKLISNLFWTSEFQNFRITNLWK